MTTRCCRVERLIILALSTLDLHGCDISDHEYSRDPCSPDYFPWGGTVIGPEGSSVTAWQQDTQMEGLELCVPAGAWTSCWEVEVSYTSIFSTPDYPDGFMPFERPWPTGSVEISIFRWTDDTTRVFAPDSMYVEIMFPLHSIPKEDGEALSGFYYDSSASDWRVSLPDDIDSEFLTIETSDWKRLWSWGRIDLTEIDYDRY